jgi:hypothetical protein
MIIRTKQYPGKNMGAKKTARGEFRHLPIDHRGPRQNVAHERTKQKRVNGYV